MDHAVISEIQTTGGTGFTTNEFVELYNPTGVDIDLSGWILVKMTSSGSEYPLVESCTRTVIPAHGFFLIAHPTGYAGSVAPDCYYTTTNSLADNNSVALVDNLGNTVDLVGWGSATVVEGAAAPNPGGGKSLERKADAEATAESMVEGGSHYFLGNGYDSGDNSVDFFARTVSEPQNSGSESELWSVVVPPVPDPEPTPDPNPAPVPDPDPTPTPSSVMVGKVLLSELFPNPVGSDDQEFIELWNADATPIDITGWIIGDTSSRTYTVSALDIPTTVIPANGYLVLAKAVTGVTLNNTTETVTLATPDGTRRDAVSYGSVREGASYSLIGKEWQWTDQPTPGITNVIASNNHLPEASFSVSVDSVKVGAPAIFDATDSSDPDGDALEYRWNFGDGQTGDGQKVEHTFRAKGSLTVRLTVIDAVGAEDETSLTVEVTEYDYSNVLMVNELLPSCTGPDTACEFIELFNPESRPISLDGWQLTDGKTSYRFSADAIIEAGGYLSVPYTDSRVSLNNSGDTVYLIDPRGDIINGVTYEKAPLDRSFSRVIGEARWQWSATPTPGEENVITEDDEAVVGTYEPDEANAEEGDNEEAGGVVTLAIADVSETYRGKIVQVTGTLQKVRNGSIYLEDDDGKVVRAYAPKDSGISIPDLFPGDEVTVTGELEKVSSGLRITLRTQSDITVAVTDEEQEGNSTPEPKVLGAATETAPSSPVAVVEEKGISTITVIILVGVTVVGAGVWYFLEKRKSRGEKSKGSLFV